MRRVVRRAIPAPLEDLLAKTELEFVVVCVLWDNIKTTLKRPLVKMLALDTKVWLDILRRLNALLANLELGASTVAEDAHVAG